jgi:Protein of unknown function (DUF2948)
MELLKLVALDEDDLAILSAHLQDAIVRVGDIAYLPAEQRFALIARRFDWEGAPGDDSQRRLAGLHFERVRQARARGIDRSKPDAVLNLLAITFAQTEAPSGTASLHFSDGGAVQLDLECIEARMKDMGPVWAGGHRPSHGSEG